MQTHNHKAYSELFEELCSHVLGLLFLVTVAAVRMRSKSGRAGRYYCHIKTITSGTGLYKHILKYYMPVRLIYNFVTCSQTSNIFLVHELWETKKPTSNLDLSNILRKIQRKSGLFFWWSSSCTLKLVTAINLRCTNQGISTQIPNLIKTC